jgi:HD-GYP domain-containing protein (c-di-GMP phosphodiesterase class II)
MVSTKFVELSGREYIPLDIDQLLTGDILPFDIYAKDINFIKYLFNKGTILTDITKAYLKKSGISKIYILERDKDILDAYLLRVRSQKSPLLNLMTFEDYSYCKEHYHQIDRALLIPDMDINFSLFGIDESNMYILLEASDASPSKIDKNILTTTGDILIRKTDICRYNAYLGSLATENLSQDMKTKATVIKENSKIIIRELFDNPRSGKKIKESIVLVNNIVECIIEQRHAMYDLLSLRNYDYYTYTHSVNVAVLSIGLGITADMKGNEIENLGVGAMLHDIGKCMIPPEILNKPEKLTDEEFEIIKTHVREGENILRSHKDVQEDSLVPVLQHHEKLTGKGYPLRLSGDAVKPAGRISAITDCYDALTTQRPYRPAYTPFDALSIIKSETGNYDSDLLATFIRMLGGIKD